MSAHRSRSTRFALAASSVALVGALAVSAGQSAGATDTTMPGGDASTTVAGSDASTTVAGGSMAASPTPSQELIDACKAEKKVNLIALPDEWANYKGILQAFRDKYPGVENPVASPEISSQEELDAVANLKGQPDMPDNLDVSPAKAQLGIETGVWEPFKPSTWDEIPEALKDKDGNWVAAYYGVMSFITNTKVQPAAPTSFAELKDPKYKGQVALNGDPRKAGSAFAAVMAASLANGGSADDIMPGIKYFAELKKAGILIPTEVDKQKFLNEEIIIALDWSYNVPTLAKALEEAGITTSTNFPTDGVYGSYYAQGVVKGSPHQNCAKLWVEHILSDEGALGYLEGGAMPARAEVLINSGKITEEMKKNLPPAEVLAKVSFLTLEQTEKANKLLQDNWGPMVADI